MSYHIYTTEGIILKRTPFGEANLLLHILTIDLGLILASARSARVEVSKLRFALQEYTLVSISCIKTRNGWKITNVVEIESFFFGYPEYTHKVLAQIVSLLIKMMPGESNHPAVFTIVKNAFVYLKTFEKENLENFEILVVLRVLYELGYVANDSKMENFLIDLNDWNKNIFENVSDNKVVIIRAINKALKESHL